MIVTISKAIDADTLINSVMRNYPEASTSLKCVDYDYNACKFHFWDDESIPERASPSVIPVSIETLDLRVSGIVPNAVTYHVDRMALQDGLQKLADLMSAGRVQFSGLSIENFEDPGCWDRDCADALVQCAVFGDVIYG